MEYLKDGDKGKGQTTDTETSGSILSVKNVSDFSAPEIRRDTSFEVPQKKSKKLLAASYMITGFLSDNEPLKWSMREKSLSVLSHISEIGNVSLSEEVTLARKIMSDIESLRTFLKVAQIAGFISEMNAAILDQEYGVLASLIEHGSRKEGFVFSDEFFAEHDKGQIKDTPKNTQSFTPKTKENLHQTSSKIVSDSSSKTNEPDQPEEQNSTPKQAEKTSRREIILQLVKDNTEVSIKDIVTRFSDCGEKTIQRELAALVQTGVLKKTGDRRWSKYSLA